MNTARIAHPRPPRRPVPRGAGLVLALLLSVGTAGLAWGQSYLSELPTRSSAAGSAAGGASESDWSQTPVDELFRTVNRGQGHQVYPALRARFDDELVRAAAEPSFDASAFRKRYLIALLRAGDGLAPAAEMERTARAFIDYYPDDVEFPIAFFHLNKALFQQGRPLEDSVFFDQAALETLPSWIQSRFLRMLAESEARQGRPAAAAAYLLAERESDTSLQQTTRAEVEDLLERLDAPMELLSFLEQHLQVTWLYEREPFLMARVLINAGQLDHALLKLNAVVTEGRATTAADLKRVNDLRQEIRSRVATRPDRIGVLLPLSSSSQVLRDLALETLEGLRMAVQYPAVQGPATAPLGRLLAQDLATGMDTRAGSAGQRRPRFELVIRDTANSPTRAAEAVETLVHEDRVVAIVGPIARSESTAAAERAEELGVPLISLSLTMDIPPDARFVFRHSKSQAEEVRDLVRYALHYLQAKRFAILFPDTSYGHAMSQLFWREVDERGGKIVAVASFEPSVRVSRLSRDRVGFKEIFERFTGVDRHLTKAERDLLESVGDSGPDPIVDFDALFVPVGPDGVQDLQLIAPYPVTVDAENVQLLGSRFWNDLSVLVAGDGKLDGAVFVDAFDLTSANPSVAAFHTRHRTLFGHHVQYRPPSYYTGLGYDTANLLMSLLKSAKSQSRPGLRDSLVQMEPYFGVTGWTRFKETGESEKESMFFRIKAGEIIRISP